MLFVDIALLVIAVGLLVFITVLFIECMAALLSSRVEINENRTHRPSVAILVPAHNEASGIATLLKTLSQQLTFQDRIVVVADNCTDDTAAVARKLGVTVLERENSAQKGKGYALDYGLRFLETKPPKVVVVVDADCIVIQNTIDRIVRLAHTAKRPVQATYLMERPTNPSPRDVVSTLAVIVKNLVRPYGLARLGLPCLLAGSGMAFPWVVIRQVSLANSKTVDDLQLSIDLALTGYPPLYCNQGKVIGRLMEPEFASSQRERWEHGHLKILLTQSFRLLKASVAQKRFDLSALALELCVPPLSLLVTIWIAVTGGAFLATLLGSAWVPLLVLAIEGLLILISIVGAWAKFGRSELSGLALLAVPFYILRKLPIYLAFLVRPQTEWIKTERDIAN
ncbi:MAG: glycosyl transferase [Cyanobacteria bacterium QS_8_48_54]|jgi:cellulose synthase/poly-beta-1,6-N-acetylglucosamine synthase-like glycosyltransferase|nr:MAG: glycosyl transferase [Cyanobacteria bacterium QH_3_48_40]PSP35327.1 MAG: glycosyl transferase [Cyanobacteria bacterium QS_8_48_54]